MNLIGGSSALRNGFLAQQIGICGDGARGKRVGDQIWPKVIIRRADIRVPPKVGEITCYDQVKWGARTSLKDKVCLPVAQKP